MPELPEVETVRRQMAAALGGRKVIRAEVLYPKAIRPLRPAEFVKKVTGATIRGVDRRAKLLLLHLTNGNSLVVHLKMTGRLLLKDDAAEPNQATEIIFDLSGPNKFFYDDIRRFGFVKLMPTKNIADYLEKKEGFGPEPLAASFTVSVFKNLLRKKPRSKIKPLLMDPTFIAGVGNIYAQEACFCAKILPSRPAASLTDDERRRLYRCLRNILRDALKHRGSSVDAYLDLFGRPGEFVPKLKVYDRAGKPCPRCRAFIQKITLAGRGTSFCPNCQL
ncbi:bifunctional DNA-formamidopyrimidine glycosylase/DNA-(apurinic or apyrimidinic site) lyase [Candidatus Uhrbacteria bacterium]|nr:bifunctional DNA-formamidopyrimidine glycosylase/DNA-(apurinic or apyrimidinic site) lyase [Candidatus Uhrbacteria bacterium]